MSIEIHSEVAQALAHGRPVVALESTLICHGLPRPRNLDLARAVEAAVRAEGAVPATIAVADGRIRVGLDDDDLVRLARAEGVVKCSPRDLAIVLARGALGATTVAGTIRVAAAAGIRVMATGGIGGVHRGGETSLDVSADLHELARSGVAVVCSGAKIILDLPRTLEVLESLGVPVVAFGTGDFPAFYARESGLTVPRIDDVAGLAALLRAQATLGWPSGMVIANPPPADLALPAAELEGWIGAALAEARTQGIAGRDETPWLLAELARRSAGRTVTLNEALVLDNARLAARLAAAWRLPDAGG
ncbi:pseudouridine-5'-phosphate glycosidase [Benzoatithermus flavus]|uniref:Pseudouridine-5'-phosphate glycosidase n=1 Tax=Benzoatithermus flavus TaxID=3108223 RepID=A0ABU8XKL8_9PROT